MPIERVTRVHEQKDLQHLTLDNRENLTITGANDVLSFSDNAWINQSGWKNHFYC